MNKIKFSIPAGSLAKDTHKILERAGYRLSIRERTYRPSINDSQIELKILRPQEIPVFVSEGLQDIGITGQDWIKENNADVEILQELDYGKIRIVTATSKNWKSVNSTTELLETILKERGKIRISTEYLNLTANYVKEKSIYRKYFGKMEPVIVTPWWKRGENPKVSIFLSFGATEAKPPENADLIVEVTETGTSLDQNNLKILETIMESTAVLIANKKSLKDPNKKEKIYDILNLLKGAVDGSKRLHIFVNVKKENLQMFLKKLPALKKPTIASLSDKKWCSVNTVIEKDVFLTLLPTIRKLAQGLVVYEPRQVLTLNDK